MAGDAGVEFAAAGVLDGDDVEGRVVVLALGKRSYGEAMYYGSGGTGVARCHGDVR
jgi:hypothetical protein